MEKGFAGQIKQRKEKAGIPIIPDIKFISPKDGDLMRGRNPIEIALMLEQLGAPALSVVTEAENFGGSVRILEDIAKRVSIPLLRKDFIKSEDDLKETVACGASAILLMCAVQSEELLVSLYEKSLKLGLEPLVEAHTEKELLFVKKLNTKLVGLNNRNILELEKDDGTVLETKRLAKFVPEDATLISESSISSHLQASSAISAGADAVLIGTAILKSDDIAGSYNTLCYGVQVEDE